MAGRLQGKVALVTAAGQGIGRAIAEAFVREGAQVIATDVDEKKVQDIKGAKSLKLDVRSNDAVDALAKRVADEFGALDVLVNCAGYVHQGNALDCSEQDWDFSFDLNVKSMHRTIKAFLPAMLKKKAGAIVNMSSAVSSIRGVPEPLRLRRHQSGGDRAHQGGRRRLYQAGHPRERDLPGNDPVPFARRAHFGCFGPYRTLARHGPPGLYRPPAHGSARHAGRSGRARGFSGLGRGELHHRAAASGGRRNGALGHFPMI